MAVNPQTPGVYIDEIPVFPASVAGVSTAVPAFIGYVEKAERNGAGILFNTPVRISSLLEYETIFGGAQAQAFTIGIADTAVVNTPTQRVITVAKGTESKFRMYYNVQMYFSNGGGPCYIVPIGLYSGPVTLPNKDDMLLGLTAISKEDEPTLLVIPEAVSLATAGHTRTVYDAALDQCQILKDRFTIMDVKDTGVPNTDASNFRTNDVGPDNLKYGASYYPFVNSTLNFGLSDRLLHIGSQTYNASPVTNSALIEVFHNATEFTLVKAQEALNYVQIAIAKNLTLSAGFLLTAGYAGDAEDAATDAHDAADDVEAAAATFYTSSVAATTSTETIGGLASTAASTYDGTRSTANANALINALKNLINSATSTIAAGYTDTADYNVDRATNNLPLIVAGSLSQFKTANPSIYNLIMAQITSYQVKVNPSGALAGIYARVDADRGVWKAPANVGVRSITGPTINITNAQQDSLNIDATSGKSINVIRSFVGRGTLVWGARTLAGNDNEWRYINVRRLFNYVEESIQEATAFVVFEPNTANTWFKVKGMIEAFLTGLWRDGALAGASSKEAFFVRVGLGITMTADDILNGKMYVEVGMAAVRPAEFIILKFEHKLQES